MSRGIIELAMLMVLLPLASVSAQHGSGRADVTFVFAESVPPAAESVIREGIRFAQDYMVSTFGRDLSVDMVVKVTYDPADIVNYARDYTININAATLESMPPLVRLKFLVHEYFHLWQEDASRRNFSSPSEVHALGPQWLVEGSAEYVGLNALLYTGIVAPGEIRERLILLASGAFLPSPPVVPELAAFQTHQDLLTRPEATCCLYELSALAVEALATDAGSDAIGEYFRALAETEAPWEEVFAATFGLTVADFYARFESQRASLLAGTGIDVTQLVSTPSYNEAPAPITLGRVPENLSPGEQSLVYGWTNSGARCGLTVPGSDGQGVVTLQTDADSYGLVFWLWSVPADLDRMIVEIEMSCGANALGVPLAVGDSGAAATPSADSE